jgi:glycosyltransferase involved in cell wall biosynthesis
MVRLSVVVATRDEGERLASTIGALLRDLPSDAEIIVVDDASRDASSEGLADYDPRVRVHHCAVRKGVAGARNLGVGLAGGSVLLLSDAHVQPCTPWTEPILAAVAASQVGVVGVALEHSRRRGHEPHLAPPTRTARGQSPQRQGLLYPVRDPVT